MGFNYHYGGYGINQDPDYWEVVASTHPAYQLYGNYPPWGYQGYFNPDHMWEETGDIDPDFPYGDYDYYRQVPGGPMNHDMGMDSNLNTMPFSHDEATLREQVRNAGINDDEATVLMGPGGIMDRQGSQGPYGYMGGQANFNPNATDYWGYNPAYYAHGGQGPMFNHQGHDTVAEANNRLREPGQRMLNYFHYEWQPAMHALYSDIYDELEATGGAPPDVQHPDELFRGRFARW